MRKCLMKSVLPATALSIASLLALLASNNAIANPPLLFSAVDMVKLQNEMVVGDALGASTLIRDKKGATGTIHVGDLPSDVQVFSVWALVFNKPGACVAIPCNPGVDAGPADLSIFWVAGGIASSSNGFDAGVLNLEFRIERKRPPGFVIPGLSQDGLTNVSGAEIHIVVAPHPEAAPGNVAFPLTHPAAAIRGAVHLP